MQKIFFKDYFWQMLKQLRKKTLHDLVMRLSIIALFVPYLIPLFLAGSKMIWHKPQMVLLNGFFAHLRGTRGSSIPSLLLETQTFLQFIFERGTVGRHLGSKMTNF